MQACDKNIMHKPLIWLGLIVLGVLRNCLCWEYCKNAKDMYCAPQKHFLCDPKQVLQGGELIGLYPLTPKLLNATLYWHNFIRSQVAQGEQKLGDKIFPAAMYMPEVIWDNELFYSAGEHAKRCNSSYAECLNTGYSRYCGQNIAYVAGDGEYTALGLLESTMKEWIAEAWAISDVERYNRNSLDVLAQNLANVINDQVTRIGCAIAKCKNCLIEMQKQAHCTFLTCNYDFMNIPDIRIYRKEDGNYPPTDEPCYPVPDFPGLCKNDGEIVPKDFTLFTGESYE